MAESVQISLEVIDKATKAIDDVKKQLDKLNTTAKEGTSTFKGFATVFSGAFAADVAVRALGQITNAAGALFDVLVVEGIKAAEEAEEAVNQLSVAFALAGQDASKATKGFVEFAEALQNTTKFSDDAIIQGAALLESLARLDSEGLQTATKAAVDLSAALNIDLDTAIRAVGKAANGNITTLQRYGIEIQKGNTDAETFANTLAVLNARFGGAAEAQVNTFAGSIARLSNIFNNLQESVGGAVVSNQSIINVIKTLGDEFQRLSDYVQNNEEEVRGWVNDGLIFALNAIELSLKALRALAQAVDFTGNSFKNVTTVISGVGALITTTFTDGLRAAGGVLEQVGKDLEENTRGAFDTNTQAIDQMVDSLGRLKTSATEGLNTVRDGGESAGAQIKVTAQAVREFTDEEKKAAEEGKKFFESLSQLTPLDAFLKKLNEINQAVAQGKITGADGQAAVEAAATQANIAEIERRQKQNEALLQLNTDAARAQIEQNNQFINDLIVQEETKNAVLAELRTQDNAAVVEGEQLKNDAIVASANKATDQIIQARAKQTAFETANTRRQYEQLGDAFSNFASLTKTKNKELFEAGKAFAISSAIINTSLAVTKALADPGGFLGGILAASYAVKGAVEIANISAQTLQTGITEVPGSGTRDNFPAILAPGERVLSRDQNRDLKDFISQQEDTRAILLMIAEGVNRDRPVSVSVGGEAIFNVVNEQIRGGRQFAS